MGKKPLFLIIFQCSNFSVQIALIVVYDFFFANIKLFTWIFFYFQASQNQQSPKAGSGKEADKNGGAQNNTQVSNSVVPSAQAASHVVVEDKKKKKCTCCVIQ